MSKNPYAKIYLIGWYKEYPKPTDFGDEVTWCQDPIGEDDECPDIEYIRADIVAAKDEQLAKANARVKELVEAGKELAMLVDSIVSGDYTADSFTSQPMRIALQKNQPEDAADGV